MLNPREEELASLKRIDYLLKYMWECAAPVPGPLGVSMCPAEGRPHAGHPYPHAREKQLPPPGEWWAWFLMSGRGFGKTRTGAEFVKGRALREPGHRTAIIAPDFSIARDVCIEGESGLRGLFQGQGVIPWDRIRTWNRSLGELTLTNGSVFQIFGTDKASDAESLRGYQCHTAWFEELGTQRHGDLAWAMLEFALRLGDDPRVVITSTPRPTKLIKRLVKDPDIVVTNGTTYDNKDNLPARQLARIKRRYENTTLGQQELFGLLLDEAVGALWHMDLIQNVTALPDGTQLVRTVIAVDPAGTHKENSDETGIVAVSLDDAGRLWVVADKSGKYSPEGWAEVVVNLYDELNADAVVAETNFGGEMVKSTLRNRNQFLPVVGVRAMIGKKLRAEPVVSLYERELIKHVGKFTELENQMIVWIPKGRFDSDGEPIPASKDSPDRLDALVYAVTDLALKPVPVRGGMRFYND